MSRKAVSMRGETVDFDLLAIKAQINGATPPAETIENREKFIGLRRKRGSKRMLQEMIAQQEAATTAPADDVAEQTEVTSEVEQPVQRRIKKRDTE